MATAYGARLLLRTLRHVSLNEFRTLNQQRWADELDMTQPQLGKAIQSLVEEGIWLLGPKEGPANTYRGNPAYEGMQDAHNRKTS